MIIVGCAFLIAWLLITLAGLALNTTLLVVAIIFLLLGLLVGERPLQR